MENLRVYKMGDYYKYIRIHYNDVLNEDCDRTIRDITNDEKLENNITRAKTNIRDLALSNNFVYFGTITFNPKFNRFDIHELRKEFYKCIRNSRKRYNLTFKYLFIPEQHTNGAWHLHGFMTRDIKDFLYLNNNGFLNCSIFDKIGFNSFDVIQDLEKASSYVTKYCVKGLSEIEKGERTYFCSKGLVKPELVFNQNFNNLNKSFFDYSTDFASIKVTKTRFDINKLLQICYKY